MKGELKKFDANRGLQLDGDWPSHRSQCARCTQFDPAKPATAGVMCLEGAVLYKRDNVERPRTVRAPNPGRVSKAHLKNIMRYKGE